MNAVFVEHLLWWGLFFGLHSLLAADRTKKYVEGKWPESTRFYRLGYNIVSVTLLLLIAWDALQHKHDYQSHISFLRMSAGWLCSTAGLAVVFLAFQHYDWLEFAGLRPESASGRHAGLQTGGLNAWVRHPLYSGSILLVLGIWLLIPAPTMLAFAVCTLLYLPFGIYWEEQKLIRQFGAEYLEYRKRVKRVIPGLW